MHSFGHALQKVYVKGVFFNDKSFTKTLTKIYLKNKMDSVDVFIYLIFNLFLKILIRFLLEEVEG